MRKFLFTVKPAIYLITDGSFTVENFAGKRKRLVRLIKAAVETEIALIQIREKQIPARLVFDLASEAVELAKNSATRILINDRADIALAANADGVHLTAGSLPAAVSRNLRPENFIVGVSAHTLEEAVRAKRQGADFITFSPIFQSPGKGAPQGIERLRDVCEQLKPFPVIALGGIDETNYEEVLEAGASGFAAIRFLNDEKNLRELRQKISKISKQ